MQLYKEPKMKNSKNSYRRIVITKFGGPEVLKIVESELHPPKAGELRIKNLATSACFTDTMVRKGIYPDVKKKPPFSPGYDVVGIIDAIGEGVTGFEIGQRVAALTVIGAYSEYIYLDSDECVPVPDALIPEEAVCLVLTYVTAYQMLRRMTNLNAGDTILIHGASGAVGTALIQLGNLYKLKMYGSASTKNQNFIKELGVIPIDYEKEDFVEKVMRMEPQGINAVFDAIAGDNFKRSFNCLQKGGTLVAYGMYNASIGKQSQLSGLFSFIGFFIRGWLPNRKYAKLYIIARMKEKKLNWFKEDLKMLFSLLEEKQIEPFIYKKFSLMNAKDAHVLLEGKVILIKNQTID
jgi:NADPH2:quinone reductase